jgi:hypothetical protein
VFAEGTAPKYARSTNRGNVYTEARWTAGRATEKIDRSMQQGQDPGPPSFRRNIVHPTLQALYDYWLGHRADRRAMLRADLDPIAIPRLLKYLILAEVGDGGREIRYRLVGTEIVAAHGFDYTGKRVEQMISGTTLDFTRKLYGLVVTAAVPVYSEGQFQWAGKEHRWTKRLHLPLSRDGGVIDLVLVGQVFEAEEAETGELLLPARTDELAADWAARARATAEP